MAENKTKPEDKSIEDFIATLEEEKRKDCLILIKILKKTTGEKPVLWTGNIIGFGKFKYKYASGHSGESFNAGLSVRKANITLYGMAGFQNDKKLMENLGKFKTSKSCLYIRKLSDVDVNILEKQLRFPTKNTWNM